MKPLNGRSLLSRKQLVEIKDSFAYGGISIGAFWEQQPGDRYECRCSAFYLLKQKLFEMQRAELLIRQNYFKYLNDYLNENTENLDQVILPSSVGLSDPVSRLTAFQG
jgi:hypothetical protein